MKVNLAPGHDSALQPAAGAGGFNHPIYSIMAAGGGGLFQRPTISSPKARVGVVVLTNQVGDVGDIARHLLRPDFPLAKPANTKRTEIALDSKVLDFYVGRYEAKGEGIFTIARENDFLTIESPADWGLPKLRIRPENQRDFFATELPLRVTFQTVV